MDPHDRIQVNPKVLVGKPVIAGTRISVELVLTLLSKGLSVEQVVATYPHISREDVLACIDYAAKRISSDEFFPAISA